jgi:hypothetical protein
MGRYWVCSNHYGERTGEKQAHLLHTHAQERRRDGVLGMPNEIRGIYIFDAPKRNAHPTLGTAATAVRWDSAHQ